MSTQAAMDWSSWTNLIANVTAAVATVLGLMFAGYQLWRAAGAAERTADAVRDTRILELLRELRDVEKALDASAKADDAPGAERAALDWRVHASKLHGLLVRRSRAEGDAELLDGLLNSITVATRTKAELLARSESVLDTTEKLRKEVAAICDRVALVGSDISAVRVEREV
jgi:hypothetical protein